MTEMMGNLTAETISVPNAEISNKIETDYKRSI
jgi:hypothetical protein